MDTAIASLMQAKADNRTVLNAQDMSMSDSLKLFQTRDDAKARRLVINKSAGVEDFYRLIERYCDRYFFPNTNTIMKTLRGSNPQLPQLYQMYNTKGALFMWIQSNVKLPFLRFQPLRVFGYPEKVAQSPVPNKDGTKVDNQSTVSSTCSSNTTPVKSNTKADVIERLSLSLPEEARRPPFQMLQFKLAQLTNKKWQDKKPIVLRQFEQYVQIHYPDHSMVLMESLRKIKTYNVLQALFTNPKKFAVHAIEIVGRTCFIPQEKDDDTLAELNEEQELNPSPVVDPEYEVVIDGITDNPSNIVPRTTFPGNNSRSSWCNGTNNSLNMLMQSTYTHMGVTVDPPFSGNEVIHHHTTWTLKLRGNNRQDIEKAAAVIREHFLEVLRTDDAAFNVTLWQIKPTRVELSMPLPSNVHVSAVSGPFTNGLETIVEVAQSNHEATEQSEVDYEAPNGYDFDGSEGSPDITSDNLEPLSWRFAPTLHPDSTPGIRTLSTSTFTEGTGRRSTFRVRITYSGEAAPWEVAHKYYHAVNSAVEEVRAYVELADTDGTTGMKITLRGLAIGEISDSDAINIPKGEETWSPYILDIARSERSNTTTFELVLHTTMNIFMMHYEGLAAESGCPAVFQHMRILQGGMNQITSIDIIEHQLMGYSEISVLTGTHLYHSINDIKRELFTRISQVEPQPVEEEMFELSWEHRSKNNVTAPILVVYALSSKEKEMINALLTLEQGDPSMYPLTHEYNVHNCTAQLAIKQLPSALRYQQYFLMNLSRLEITQYPGLWLPPPAEVTPGSPNTDDLKIHELLVRIAGLFQTATGSKIPYLFTESLYRNGSLILLFDRSNMSTVLFNLKALRDMLSNWLDPRVMATLSITIPGVTYLNGHGAVHPSELESMLASAVTSAQSRADAGDDSQVDKLMAIIGLAQSKLRPTPQDLPPTPATNGNVDQEAIVQGVLQALQKLQENNDPLLGTIGVRNQETVSSPLSSISEEKITSIMATSFQRVLMMKPAPASDDDDAVGSGPPDGMNTNQMTLLQMALGATLGNTENLQRRVATVLSDIKADIHSLKSSQPPVPRASPLDAQSSEIMAKVNLLCDTFAEGSNVMDEVTHLRNNYIHMQGCMEMCTKVWTQTFKFTAMFRSQVPQEHQTPELNQAISRLEELMRLTWQLIEYEKTRRMTLEYRAQHDESEDEDGEEDTETLTAVTEASTTAQSCANPLDNTSSGAGAHDNSNLENDTSSKSSATPTVNSTAAVVTSVKPENPFYQPLSNATSPAEGTSDTKTVDEKEQRGASQENTDNEATKLDNSLDGGTSPSAGGNNEAKASNVEASTADQKEGDAVPSSNTAVDSYLTPPALLDAKTPDTDASFDQGNLATQPEDQAKHTLPDPPTGFTPKKGDPAECPSEDEDKDEVKSEAIYIPPSRIHPDSAAPVDVFLKAPTVTTNLPESYVIIKGIPDSLDIFNTHIHDKNEDSWQVGDHRSSIAHLLISTTRGIPGDEEKWLLNGISIQDGTLRLHGNTEFLRHNYTHLRNHIRPWFPEEDAEQIEFTFHEIGNEAGSEGGVHSPIEPVKLDGKMGATDGVTEAAQSTVATATDGDKVAPTTNGGEQICSEDNNSSDNNAAKQNDTDGFNIGKGKSANSTTERKKRVIKGKRPRFERELESNLKK